MIPENRPGRAEDPAGQHVWESLAVWEILLVVAILLPAVFIVFHDISVPEKAVAAGCLVAVLPLYLLFGRPAIVAENRRRGTVYIVLLIVLFACSASISSTATFALFGLCPQCFMVYPTKGAMIPVIVLSVAHIPRHLFPGGGPDGFEFLTVTVIAILFSAVFGLWMDRVAAQSMDRADLIRELVDSRAEVSRLSAERGAMAERERLAGEIHDTLAQGFTSIIMLLQAAQAQPDPGRHLGLAVQTARENLAEARALVAALSPAPLDGSTLDEALVRLADRLGEETGIAVAFAVHGESRALQPAVEVVLIRAAQEALANVRKHAAAERVDISAAYGPGRVALEVRDDGVGFGPSAAEGYGLRGMRSRVEQVGGSLRVRSSRGAGTTLTVEVAG
ncbi:sensor histidine kinase [Streptosporangium sp. NPDC051023]|uniref:sensor histidine kinase n=1 Tax=Streptosporangium sp. NPDC051023 TaxID=3155410 RepID=UPI00344CD14D